MRIRSKPHPFFLLSKSFLMPFLALLIEFAQFQSLLVHFLPFANRTFDTEGRNTDAGRILESGFVSLLASFFR